MLATKAVKAQNDREQEKKGKELNKDKRMKKYKKRNMSILVYPISGHVMKLIMAVEKERLRKIDILNS